MKKHNPHVVDPYTFGRRTAYEKMSGIADRVYDAGKEAGRREVKEGATRKMSQEPAPELIRVRVVDEAVRESLNLTPEEFQEIKEKAPSVPSCLD